MSVQKIAVIGGGTMGSGIALTAATSGLQAVLVDISEDQLVRAKTYHEKQLARAVSKERMTQEEADSAIQRVSYVTSMGEASDSDWVVEAATENIDVKKTIFKQMFETFGNDVVLATNTSSISISDLATSIPEAANRVIGMHFFNPVPVMKLVEVIKGKQTSDETTAATIALSEAMGKIPVPANDFAGFVSNRVLMPMINEAFHAWSDGVAEPEDIDSIMKLGCAFPMGPLRLADYIGLDVCRDIMMVMYNGLNENPKYLPNDKLAALVEAGNLGDKTGQGVYSYEKR
ncbi:MAG: 3-hydroxyacyl-CoA dehydrogenase NAD-binding domain-containing protein [Phycisphaerales bacterium]|jgi:3-hydroxybutyryl-CoA dehydrogenase|nr:3-hydroxyacyl-CoA dehydrogenase NAD-binding domain-containing protein [Phycisphaerales bacterium]